MLPGELNFAIYQNVLNWIRNNWRLGDSPTKAKILVKRTDVLWTFHQDAVMAEIAKILKVEVVKQGDKGWFESRMKHQEKLFFPWVSPKYTQRLQECQRAGKLERNPEQGHRGTVFLEVSGVVPRLLPGELKLTVSIFLCPCNCCTLLVELYIFLRSFIYPTSSITIVILKSS